MNFKTFLKTGNNTPTINCLNNRNEVWKHLRNKSVFVTTTMSVCEAGMCRLLCAEGCVWEPTAALLLSAECVFNPLTVGHRTVCCFNKSTSCKGSREAAPTSWNCSLCNFMCVFLCPVHACVAQRSGAGGSVRPGGHLSASGGWEPVFGSAGPAAQLRLQRSAPGRSGPVAGRLTAPLQRRWRRKQGRVSVFKQHHSVLMKTFAVKNLFLRNSYPSTLSRCLGLIRILPLLRERERERRRERERKSELLHYVTTVFRNSRETSNIKIPRKGNMI